jgi:PAS domain S-box-containing protein
MESVYASGRPAKNPGGMDGGHRERPCGGIVQPVEKRSRQLPLASRAGLAGEDSHQQISMWVGTATDVHQQKMAAQELEKNIAERTIQLSEAIRDLKREIEERILVEEQLRESQHFISQVASTMPDLLYVYDPTRQQKIYINRDIFQQLGYTAQEHIWSDNGKLKELFRKILHPAHHENFLNIQEKYAAVQDGDIVESVYRLRHKNGTWHWFQSREVVFTRNQHQMPRQILGVAQDITQKVEAEAEIRSKNEIIQGILKNLPVFICRISHEMIIEEATGFGLQHLGIADNELSGKSADALFPEITPGIRKALSGKTYISNATLGHDGHKRIYQMHCFQDVNQQGVILFCLDVTRQKEAEMALHESNLLLMQEITERKEAENRERLQKEFTERLIENSMDGIFAIDMLMQLTVWNKAAEEITGLSKAAVIGSKLEEVFPDFESVFTSKEVKQVLYGKKKHLRNKLYQLRQSSYEINMIPLVDEKIIGGLFIVHNITERRLLEAERTRLELQQQKELMNAILEAQEGEKKRISEALHNGVGQILYATRLNVELLNQYISADSCLLEVKNNINNLLEDAIRETRSISYDLVPTILQDFGLKAAIQDLSNKVPEKSLQITYDLNGFDGKLEKYLEIAIFRICQELMNNVLKHAAASKATIQLAQSKREICIKVTDNGEGFDIEKLAKAKGIGLQSIRDRVRLLNGTMKIKSHPDKGTAVTIKLPFSR